VVWDILNALVEGRTDEAAERYRERIRHVRRYTVVRDLLSSDHTMTVTCALDRAEESLAQQLAAVSRRTIEASYYEVKNDLDRQGRESEYFYLVELAPEAPALAPRADSTPWTTDGTIPTADTAGDTAAPVASVPWFTRIAKR
jgi:hypothetical protein